MRGVKDDELSFMWECGAHSQQLPGVEEHKGTL